MFKLIKIINGRGNVPEPQYLKCDGKVPYYKGCLYFVSAGEAGSTAISETDMKFISLETIPENSGKTEVCGFIVNENMVFETDCYNDSDEIAEGDIVMIYQDDKGENVGVEAVSGVDARIIDKSTSKINGKVLVTLK